MNLVEIKDFGFSYPESSRKVLEHVNLNIKEGTLNVIMGRSGCGKSTLLRQLKSVLAPAGEKEGKILYRNIPLEDTDHRTQSQEIGFVMQNPDNQIVTDKVWHELAFGLESLGYDNATIRLRVAEMASYFGIQKWFYKNVSELSGGQKQLLNLASVMAMHPSLLILDEPTSQLDPIAASDFLETVKKINRDIGTTVLLTEHRLQDIIPYADRVFVMDEGPCFWKGQPGSGTKLKEQHHGMFLSMPFHQIYAGTESAYLSPYCK
ncbi:MAG: ABC transporter ATP-binding protein [Clostridium sp.]